MLSDPHYCYLLLYPISVQSKLPAVMHPTSRLSKLEVQAAETSGKMPQIGRK